jgi:methionyl-tRNA formyltransferase
LVWFVVIGEGRPARVVLDFMVEEPGVSVGAMVLENPVRNPLAEFARRHKIAVFDTQKFTREAERLAGGMGGWLINANSTFIVPGDVLALFEGRCLNFHPGLLPEYAGLHTHQWAIRNGEREFGVTVHRMERRIDTGAIVGQVRFPIKPDDTRLSLFNRCLSAGAELLARIVAQIARAEALTDIAQERRARCAQYLLG